MRPLAQSVPADFAGVEFVLTDMDDTLTFRGRLAASTYGALERLQASGIRIIPVTAAPAGWCDQMVRLWPVDAVIGENGGVSTLRRSQKIERSCWEPRLDEVKARLSALCDRVLSQLPSIGVAADQPFRLTSLAFDRPPTTEACMELCAQLRADGAQVTVNSLWVLAWFGGYDKLIAARRFMADAYGIDIDAQRERVVYVGDSTNDGPMFRHFPRSVGVSTVTEYLHELDSTPAWITRGPGGEGFIEVAEIVLAARTLPPS